MQTYPELESRIGQWCSLQPDVRAAVIIGSRGRLSPPPDEFSDLDLILFVRDPARFTADSEWIHELGRPWITALNNIGQGDPEWLVLFAGGLKADLLIIAAGPDEDLDQWLVALPYQQILRRGARVLYDAGSARKNESFTPPHATSHDLPTESEFTRSVNNALFTVERTAKFIRRNDHWRSRTSFGELRQHFLALIEWHAAATPGAEPDTWYEGRFIESWADDRIMSAVEALSIEQRDSAQSFALLSTVETLEWLITETAARLGYRQPTHGQQKTLQWLKQDIAVIGS